MDWDPLKSTCSFVDFGRFSANKSPPSYRAISIPLLYPVLVRVSDPHGGIAQWIKEL